MPEKDAPQTTEKPTNEETLDDEAPVVEEPQPFTAEQFSAALDTLVTRAKEAGLRPIRMMASAYIAQGLSMVDGLLGAFEGSDKKKDDK